MLTVPKIVAAVALVLAFAGTAQANSNARVATLGRAVVTPLPMQFFCAQNPRECVASRATQARWNDDLHQMLQTVNRQVNAAIRPQANPRGGWKINPRSGDCNDYALTKRSQLIELGVPAGALRLAVTATRRGEKHLILVVKTTAGDVVLDNLSRNVMSLEASGYAIHSISGANPRRWTAG